MRCWIIACLMFLAAEFLSSGLHFSVREVMQFVPRLIAAVCGVVLFISSLFCFAWDWRFACWGLVVSLPSPPTMEDEGDDKSVGR